MSHLSVIANLSEVRSAVLGDLSGGLVDAVREPDGESVAAVVGFLASTLVQAGAQLGLGALRRIVIGGAKAWVVAVRGESVVAAWVDPATAVGSVEKAIDSSLQARG